MDPEHLISLKLNSEPHLHTEQKWEYYPPTPQTLTIQHKHAPSGTLVLLLFSSGGEVNTAALWAALSGGISADAMSID